MYIFGMIMLSKRKKERMKILEEFFGTDDLAHVPENFHQVNAIPGPVFFKMIKWTPWLDPGWLISKHSEIIIICSHKGDIRELRFSRRASMIEWEGYLLRNGFLSWFRLEQDDELLFITSENGVTVVGSKSSTRKIYEDVKFNK